MAAYPRRSLSLLFATLAACAGNDWTAGQDMSVALDEAAAENDRHAWTCAGAESMPDMMAEVTRHEDAMARVMEHMDDARDPSTLSQRA